MEMILFLLSRNVLIINFCVLIEVLGWIFDIFCSVFLYYFVLISGECYVVLKYFIFYNRSVINIYIVICLVIVWFIVFVICFLYGISEIFVIFSNVL